MTALEKIGPQPTRLGGTALYDWDYLVQEDRAHRLIYTDPAIFEAEMTNIFGGTWTYLAHESEIPNANDFITRRMGLRPLIIVRDADGKIRALYNRCTHRGTTLCRWEKGNTKSFQCPYHGWNFLNTGRLRGVPWPEGYAADLRDPKYNLAQVPRVESYRGFIFGTLNLDALPLVEHLGPISTVIDDWLDRNPGGKVVVCEANRFRYKGNWKLAYDNSCDGYHVAYSHRSLLETENRFAGENAKGMAYYRNSPDTQPMYMRYTGHGNHFKDKRPNLEKRPGGLWAVESAHPGMEHYEADFIRRYGDRAFALLDQLRGDQRRLVRHHDCRRGRQTRRRHRYRHQRAAHAHPGRFSEFRRSRRHRQFRADPARSYGDRGRVGLHEPRPRHSRPRQDTRRRLDHRAGDRRGVHARALQGMETAHAGAAEFRHPAGAVT